jgi:tRNA(Leu) C34 or U34 (ribose-2'-O)-methylase TrmL
VHRWATEAIGPDSAVTLPMLPDPRARSLNLATAVACAVYEGLRQAGGIDGP